MQISGAQITIRLLERQGIETIAGIPGGANLPLYDALGESSIRHILARHEQGAGFIAQGMARVSGRPAVCFGTSGPGATNLLTAIADAKLDSIPMVAITGQVPTAMIGTDAFQEIDTYGLTLPITKHNWLVRSAAELLEVIPRAFALAASGRPGPVAVDIPKDVQNEVIDVEAWPEPGRGGDFGFGAMPALDPAQIGRMAELIAQARRPVLYIGGGVVASGAGETVRRVAETAQLPTTTTLMGLGVLPVDHPLYLGMLGMHGARYTNLALEECDLLIAAGVRFDDRATGKVAEFCPEATVIHVDIDPAELGKIRSPFLGIVGDVGAVFAALGEQIDAPCATNRPRRAWLERIQWLKAAHPLEMPGADDPRLPYGLIRQSASLLDEDAIIATDVGQHQMWVAQAYPFRRPRTWLTSGGLGTMGFGLPAAIGAALAEPERTVVCYTGDGSILMNLQEMAVAAEEGLNLKVILMNNGHLGLVRQQQSLFYGGRLSAVESALSVDFIKIAEGFGWAAYDLAAAADPLKALAEAFSRPGPCLVNAPIDAEEMVFPMVPPGAANKQMIGGEAHV